MAATLDRLKGVGKGVFKLPLSAVPTVTVVFYLHGDLKEEVFYLHGDLKEEVRILRENHVDLVGTVNDLQVQVARIEERQLLRSDLARRFAASGEETRYGDPVSAADALLALAPPDIEAKLRARDIGVRTELGTLDTDPATTLADELWEDRANILAQAVPIP